MFDAIYELFADLLVCPRSKQTLRLVDRAQVEALGLRPIRRTGLDAEHFHPTDQMLLTQDGQSAFAVAHGIPVLMWPEVFTAGDATVDLKDRIYVEAYSEMAFYNPRAGALADQLSAQNARAQNAGVQNASAGDRPVAPAEPLSDAALRASWVDTIHDSKALADAIDYLLPLRGADFLQLGGDGRYAIRALLGGARRALLITPMLSEAREAQERARAHGVADRLLCLLGIGEEIPLQSASIDKIFSPGCMHHMRLDQALPEMKAVLRPGGRFAAFDPWRAPLYGIGNAVFGKRAAGMFRRSKNIMCTPLTEATMEPLEQVFTRHVRKHHGPLLRYPLCACEKFGLRLTLPTMQKIADFDDKLGEALHLDRHWGSSMMFGGEA